MKGRLGLEGRVCCKMKVEGYGGGGERRVSKMKRGGLGFVRGWIKKKMNWSKKRVVKKEMGGLWVSKWEGKGS